MLGRILRLMRMRNIVIASIFGSGYGYYHNHTFFPNFKAFRDYIDSLEFGEYLNFDKESLIKSLYGANDLFKDNINKYSDVIHEAYVDMLKKVFVPIEYSNETNQNFLSQFDDFALTNGSMAFMPFPSLNSISTKQTTNNEKTAQDDLLELQLKYQKEIENLERENKELRKQLILKTRLKANEKSKRIKKSVIDLYSEVLDDLNEYDTKYNAQDHLPKIVVVGDQSSGKTSVLEMIAQARIFPRGSGEMMTRSPVKVTLSEGPYHIAQFKDSEREFDLSKEKDLAALRREIELRMIRGLKDGKTISTDTVALTVKGPGLPRMVLIDLPGIISTVTTDMAPDTKDAITKLVKTYMANPNSIIMCIQGLKCCYYNKDGSVDAERSNVTDLVSSIDPAGHRTIFVLTKVDMAEQNLFNPARVKKILEGKLFPMKALGYFAVVTGRGNSEDSIASIKAYEEDFFRNSKLFKAGVFRPHQMTTHNMSLAVSECFWKMVRESIEQQADSFKAVRFNLETEWKNSFPKLRELDREELFEKARTEILDEILGLNHVTSKQWEDLLFHNLWGRVNDFVMENIYIQALTQSSANPDSINTLYDIKLREWAEHGLPQKSVQTGWASLESQIQHFLNKSKSDSQHDEIFDPLKKAVLDQANEKHRWDQKAIDSLRVIQLNALEDRSINDKYQWDIGLKFLEKTIQDRLHAIENVIKESRGPSWADQWFYWKSKTTKHQVQALIQDELDAVYKARVKNGTLSKKKENSDSTVLDNVRKSHLEPEEILVVKKSVQNKGYDDVDEEAIKNAWYYVFRNNFFMETLDNAKECRKAFYYYQQGGTKDKTFYRCNDVVLFWRIQRMLQSTSNALRQQITNAEARRFEKEIKEILDDLSQDKDKLESLLTGRRVTLAEELKRVRHIQEKIDEFMQALNKDKS